MTSDNVEKSAEKKPFMSLREFLLLKDPTDREPKRSVFRCASSLPRGLGRCHPQEDMVTWYDIAKASWEEFGEAGPPPGIEVQMLLPGHGGLGGEIRTLEGVCEDDPRFFAVSRIDYFRGKSEKRISLVNREVWFVEMRVWK